MLYQTLFLPTISFSKAILWPDFTMLALAVVPPHCYLLWGPLPLCDFTAVLNVICSTCDHRPSHSHSAFMSGLVCLLFLSKLPLIRSVSVCFSQRLSVYMCLLQVCRSVSTSFAWTQRRAQNTSWATNTLDRITLSSRFGCLGDAPEQCKSQYV